MNARISVLILSMILPIWLFAQAPQITEQPINKTVCENSFAKFSLTASGSATLSYEWFFGGVSIGNDNSQLTIDPATDSDEGDYYCVVTNGEGNVQSQTVQLTIVNDLPSVTSQTTGGQFCEGSYKQFDFVSEGEAVNYQWYFNTNAISGAYGPTYSLSNISDENEGTYYCQLSNVCGDVNLDDIEIEIIDTVNIDEQLVGQVVCVGEDATFTLEASGSSLEYQWYENGVEISGEINSTLIVPDVSSDMDGLFSCEVSNTCGSQTTIEAGMTVNTYPQVTANPITANACLGEELSLISTATGTPEITSQWYVNGLPVTDSTGSTITLMTQENDTSYCYNAFTNGCGTVNSDSAMVITDMPPTITQQPVDTFGCVGVNRFLQVKAVGKEPLTYQWQLGNVDVVGDHYTGNQTNLLFINDIDQSVEGDYTCIVTNTCGEIVSDVVHVTVLLPPAIISQPDNVELCMGDTANLNFTVQGTEPFEFSWENPENGVTLNSNEDFVINGLNVSHDNDYFCVVSNYCGDVSTDTVTIEVNTPPSFIIQPEDLEICHGDSAAIFVSVEGSEPMDLLWFRNQGAISGEEDSILVFNPAETLETGYYMCTGFNECGITESDEVYVNIGTAPAITWQPFDQTMCENENLTLYSDASGENVYYQWYNNGEAIPGQNDTALFIPYIDDDMSGEFYFQAYNGCAVVNSDIVDVTINPAPEIDLGEDLDFCNGESVLLEIDEPAQSYEWNNGISTASFLDVDQTGEYFLKAIGENGCIGYDTIFVEFHNYHYVNFPDEQSNCGVMNLDVGEGAYSYIWNTGATESSIEITESGQYYVTTEGDSFGCISSDTTFVNILELPVIDIGEDHTILHDSSVVLSVDEGYLAYHWSNGANINETEYFGETLGVGVHDAWVNVTHENGCVASDTVTITVLQNDAVNQLTEDESISMYPNPVGSNLVLQYNLEEEIVGISMLDMQGKVIYSQAVNSYEGIINVDTQKLSSGMYVMNIRTKSRSVNYRLIKE